MNSTKFVCTHMLAQSACDALFSETVGTEFFCPPCEFFALVFQSQQKFQATITKKLTESHSTHFVCAHMLVQSACDAIFSKSSWANFFLCPCEFFALVFQSQQKFQATITKKLTESHSTHFVCAHMLVQSACDAIFSQKAQHSFFLCPCEFFFLLNPYRTDFLKFSQKMLCF